MVEGVQQGPVLVGTFFNSECALFEGFTPNIDLHCEASQYKWKMASYTYIRQSVSMKKLKK